MNLLVIEIWTCLLLVVAMLQQASALSSSCKQDKWPFSAATCNGEILVRSHISVSAEKVIEKLKYI